VNFYEAWWWLHNHPINIGDGGHNYGMYDLDIFVARVNPATNRIENAENLNTDTRIWLEFGPWEDVAAHIDENLPPNWQRTHDPNLDCGGATFEAAIINLAGKVKKHYGDYGRE